MMRQSMQRLNIIERYIIIEILRPFFTSLAFFVSLFLAVALRESLGDLIAKGIALEHIASFLFSSIIVDLPNILPALSLFAGLLAASRLSSDQEISAMRSIGLSYKNIYGSFFKFGLLLFAFALLLKGYVAPKENRYKRALSELLYVYHSLAFVRPGRFFNSAKGMGSHRDIYAQSRKGSQLENIYVHRWRIEDSSESSAIRIRGSESKVGKSRTQQILFARRGALIVRPKQAEGGQALLRNTTKAQELPLGLRGRSLFDLSFLARLPEIENPRLALERQKYIRLEEGFSLEFMPGRQEIQSTDFRKGFIDYPLNKPPAHLGYFAIDLKTLSFFQLLAFYYRMESGGIVFHLDKPHVKNTPPAANYVELPTLKLRPILEKHKDDIAQLSPEEIYKKWALYIPSHLRQAADRKEHLQSILDMSKTFTKLRPQIAYLAHRHVASSFAVLLFLLLAFPLGLQVQRSARGANFSLALLGYMIYSAVGNVLKMQFEKGNLGIITAAWLAEAMLLLCCIGLAYRLKSKG